MSNEELKTTEEQEEVSEEAIPEENSAPFSKLSKRQIFGMLISLVGIIIFILSAAVLVSVPAFVNFICGGIGGLAVVAGVFVFLERKQ